jgi:hypothetical protein
MIRAHCLPRPAAALSLLAALALAAPATAKVTLTAVDGSPVAGARVRVLPCMDPDSPDLLRPAGVLGSALSDERGIAALQLPDLACAVVTIDAAGFAPRLVALAGEASLALTLDPGSAFTATVHAPVEPSPGDARACARGTLQSAGSGRELAWSRCTPLLDDGSLRLAGLPSGPFDLRVEVPGLLPHEGPGQPGGRLEIALETGVAVAARVVDTAGRPIEGAEAKAAGAVAVRSDRHGAVRLAVPELPADIEVAAPGYRPASRRVERSPGAGEDGPVFVLADGEEVVARVFGGAPGAGPPVEAVEVTLLAHPPDDRWTRSRFDVVLGDEGALSLALPAPGRYRLEIRAAGHRPAILPELEVEAGAVHDLGDVHLSLGGAVVARLVDPRDGTGVAGAQVTLIPQGPAFSTFLGRGGYPRAVSDEEGRVVIGGLDGGGFDLLAEHRDFAELYSPVVVERDRTLDLGSLVLSPGVHFTGVVLDRRERPRPGVAVRLYPPGVEPLVERRSARTGPDGSFAFERLAPGTHRLQLVGSRVLLDQEIEIPPDVVEWEEELVVGGTALHGLVTAEGEPLGGGRLALAQVGDPTTRRPVTQVTDRSSGRWATVGAPASRVDVAVSASGFFEIEDAPTGPLLATYRGADGRVLSRRVDVPESVEEPVAIDFGGAAIAGRVFDHYSGEAIAADFSVVDAHGLTFAQGTADGAGGFRTDLLPPGRYTLQVSSDGYVTESRGGLEPGASGQRLELAMTPEEDADLEVRLERDDGSPIASIFLALLDARGEVVRFLRTDSGGALRAGGLAPGLYHLVWSDPVAGAGAQVVAMSRRDGPVRVERVLPPGGEVILHCDAADCPGASLQVVDVRQADGAPLTSWVAGGSSAARLSAAGTWSLGRLAPGRYQLEAVIDGRRVSATLWAESGLPSVAELR